MILDGWGIGKHDKGDVIFKTPTPYLDYLTAVSAHSTLQTCGEDVTMSWSELPDVAKWFCSLMMLIGRLEIFSVLVILTPAFWREN